MADTKCAATTATGNPCRRNATQDGYCTTHAGTVATTTGTTSHIGDPDTHITINAVVNYILGGVTLAVMFMGAVFLMVGAEIMANFMEDFWAPMGDFYRNGGALVGMMAFFMGLIVGLPQILAGVGLSRRAEWGRIMALVVAAFHILFGLTLFDGNTMAILNLGYGGYAFWSLLQAPVVARFRAGATA